MTAHRMIVEQLNSALAADLAPARRFSPKRTGPGFPWDDPEAGHEAELRRRWGLGESGSVIAAALAHAARAPLTASAVIAKARRLRLARRAARSRRQIAHIADETPRGTPSTPRRIGPHCEVHVTADARALQALLTDALAAPRPQGWLALGGAPLLALEPDACRAPLGKTDGALTPFDRAPVHRFCGDPARAGSSYCARHHSQFWKPWTPKAQAEIAAVAELAPVQRSSAQRRRA